MGGWQTFGIQHAFDAVITPPTPGQEAIQDSGPVGVVNPDGTVTSVGFPEGGDEGQDEAQNGIGKSVASPHLIDGLYSSTTTPSRPS